MKEKQFVICEKLSETFLSMARKYIKFHYSGPESLCNFPRPLSTFRLTFLRIQINYF